MIPWDALYVILLNIGLWLIILAFVIRDIMKVEYYYAALVITDVLLVVTETKILVCHVALH